MSYRVLLVDDEPLARERLKRLLQEHSQFECAGGHIVTIVTVIARRFSRFENPSL